MRDLFAALVSLDALLGDLLYWTVEVLRYWELNPVEEFGHDRTRPRSDYRPD